MTILFFWVGLIFFAIGVCVIVSEVRSRQNTFRITGEIVGYSTGRNTNPDSLSYHAVVQFTSADGNTKYVESSIGSNAPLGAVGNRVNVLVRREDPNTATLESSLIYLLGFFLAAMGVISLAVFIHTFQTDWISIGLSALVTAGLIHTIWKKRRTQKLSWEDWNKYRKEAIRSRVFSERDEVPWASHRSLVVSYQRQAKSELISLPILLTLGIGLSALSFHLYQRKELFLEKAVPVRGTVVDLVEVRGSDDTTYAPMIEFNPSAGASPIRFKHSVSSSPPAYREGESVDVLYDPSNPQDARVDWHVWNQWPAYAAGGAGLLSLLAFIRVLQSRRERQTRSSQKPPAIRSTGKI